MKLILGICTLVAACSASAFAENPKDELRGVKREIKAQKQLITKTRKVEAVVSTELKEILRNLEQKESALGRLSRDLVSVESSLERTGREINVVTEEANRKRSEIERRLASLYKAGELGALRMFFSAESFPQLAENIRYMKSILENDRRIFLEYNQKIEQLTTLKATLEHDAIKKERIMSGIEQKKREIELEKSKKAAYLGKVRQDRKSYEVSLKELQANASRLQAMITRLNALSRRKLSSRHEKPGNRLKPLAELPSVPDRGFASQRGRMALPVKGEIIESYGKHKHPEFNSFTYSKGLSIRSPSGSEIKAIYDGTVIFSDYFKGFGNMIIVDHGGGYFSLYAHALRLAKKVGAEVARHEVIGAVGDVDSSKGSILYFEIRHQGKPVDPAEWVR
ncbi:MAG: peptidoglycan DD-metalloendopeptidase family protein [Desulfuromonadaceae bacterium]|nr:peptidoglycan DD-metalloendopeptidase family protein [Desulfuromonadaceae bacterium]MDD5106167.1 peptidoglycan DD-metalloendopeptidase family protein [Desulfuromonadaceae bacterium]